MAKKSALGRGLDALLEEQPANQTKSELKNISETSIINIDPKLLQPNPYQPRKTFDEETLNELAESIKEHGIIQPIVAEKNSDNSFFIIAGERRTRAALRLGLKTVPVIIRSFEEKQKLEIALIENIQREDLNAIDEALAYQEIMELTNINQEDLAKRVGKSRSAITNSLRLLKLPEEMKEALRIDKISAGHARSLLSIVNPADQKILFSRILESELSVREAESMAADLNSGIGRITKKQKKETASLSTDDFELRNIEQQFINSLGTKVQIKGNLKKGVVEISYFSKDDLDMLYKKINS
ncbi:ParB/RepB/Spo0J family partition protein [Treponema putidum]|uniref:ParB/RepB/Spo0J family partition protein n=1 Tax=Treponema putidum TaxID=221027 RepID=A0AAE9MWC1_9SPIR|nr:ParB/RepB/Spo0J family partition protein [Treponema putidum]UTY29412.1 ParB/RepB/Spo0J family partition protein [Treponema putidum]UTY31906.1 ParB/RepB/Spo0J family partition protein [Treponema putidum]UTY34268.1 ParB/RepB/Spo0J family partition protein [Treponema putidum]